MSVSERDPRVLHHALVARIGEQEADVLMELLSRAGWSDLATKSDLAALASDLDLKLEAVEARLSAGFPQDMVRQTWIFVATTLTSMGLLAGLVGH